MNTAYDEPLIFSAGSLVDEIDVWLSILISSAEKSGVERADKLHELPDRSSCRSVI